MLKKIVRYIASMVCAFTISVGSTVSAATAIVVFAPGCKYMTENFHEIAKALISPYFDEIAIGENIDEAYSMFSDRARKHFDERFAATYGWDYLIQIYVSSPSSWNATHTNAHTGHQTPLAMGGVTVHMVTADAQTGEYFTGPGVGHYSNHGHWRNMDTTTWNIYDEVFVENMYDLVKMHAENYWPKKTKVQEEPEPQ